MYYLPVYLELIKVRVQSLFQHRAAYLSSNFVQAASYATEFLLIWVLISQFRTIGEWGPYEVMFLFALNLFSYGLAGAFLFWPCAELSMLIQSGEFDAALTKPLNSLPHMVFKYFAIGYYSHLSVAGAVLVVCVVKLEIAMTPVKILFLVMTLAGGALIQGAAFIFTSVPSFWLIKNTSLMRMLMFDLKGFIRYPISIYNKALQVFLTLIVPYAFINFYPAQYFLKKNDFLMFHPVFQFLTPLVGILLFVAAYKFWNIGVNHYQSTGS